MPSDAETSAPVGDAGGDDVLFPVLFARAILFRRSGRAGVVVGEAAGGLVDSESGSKDVGLEGDRLRPIWRNWNSGRGADVEVELDAAVAGVSVAIFVYEFEVRMMMWGRWVGRKRER